MRVSPETGLSAGASPCHLCAAQALRRAAETLLIEGVSPQPILPHPSASVCQRDGLRAASLPGASSMPGAAGRRRLGECIRGTRPAAQAVASTGIPSGVG